MKNKAIKLTVFALLLLCAGANAQSKKDSSNVEIQKQALEMREKLNKYMSDRLLLEEQKKDTSLRTFVDSISTQLYQQQEEIEKLKQQFSRLEKAILNGEVYTSENGTQGDASRVLGTRNKKDQSPPPFQQYGEKQLNLYFAFDEYRLSQEQLKELRTFLKGKKINRVTVNGYTDWKGTEKHNEQLGNKRCMSVVKVLNSLIIHFKTNDNYHCDNNNDYSPEKAQWCRRVEVIIK